MKHYVGLDISMKETFVCIVDETGQVVKRGKCPTNPSRIAKYLGSTELDFEKIGLECGTMSGYLTKELRGLGFPAICIDARKMAVLLSVKINKTDTNDAAGIADAMRCNHYTEVSIKTDEEVEISTLLSSRRALVEQRTLLSNTIRGFLRGSGIRIDSGGMPNFPTRVLKATHNLVDLEARGIAALLQAMESLNTILKELDARVKKIAHDDEATKLLMTAPGVGAIVALTFRVAVGDPKRFKKSRLVGAYFGLTPKQYSSGETVRQGRISKCGQNEVRSLLTESALVLMMRSRSWTKLRAWGLRIAERRGFAKAKIAVARKLAVILHRMLVNNKPFSYGKTEEKTVAKAA